MGIKKKLEANRDALEELELVLDEYEMIPYNIKIILACLLTIRLFLGVDTVIFLL